MKNYTGNTIDVGFQFGIRRTFPVTTTEAWDIVFSEEGRRIWLGETDNELEPYKSFATKEGIIGSVRVIKPGAHIRLNWTKRGWENMSRVQLRIIENQGRATISFHHEKLLNIDQREEVKAYWNMKIRELGELIRARGKG